MGLKIGDRVRVVSDVSSSRYGHEVLMLKGVTGFICGRRDGYIRVHAYDKKYNQKNYGYACETKKAHSMMACRFNEDHLEKMGIEFDEDGNII